MAENKIDEKNEIQANIKKVKDILKKQLAIPDFQRPYCWGEDNVHLLLQDVYDSWKSGKQSYRIGSTILYKSKNNDTLQIVDGQQRITTILLVLRMLNDDFIGKELYKTLNYEHEESQKNIFNNDKYIRKWIVERIANEKSEFYKYLMEYCEFVEIIVSDLSEAFQMFDSQNGRGKELEAYNLLKAYHIRAMETEEQETKIECDKKWESATKYKIEPKKEKEKETETDILRQVINEQLYRTRKWSRKDAAYDFNKSHISEFKGVTIDKQKSVNFPFQNTQLLNYITIKYFESMGLSVKGVCSRFNTGDSENINPFVLINQNIINGKHFFDYIETYVEIYKILFINEQLEFLKNAIKNYCPRGGKGNEAMFELFKSIIFLVFDKFGENMIKKYWKDIYSIVYRIRLLNSRNVNYEQVAKYPNDLFSQIEEAKNEYDLRCISDKASKIIKIAYSEKWRQDEKIKAFYLKEDKNREETKTYFEKKYNNENK